MSGELPASIESVDSATTQERGGYTIMDAITRATGVSGVGSGGNGAMSFSTRGFSGTNSVGLAEDGMRLSTGAGTQNYPNDSWGYERIEVLRGPASVVYGSGTVGATINAVRKAPSRTASAEALFGIGTDGTGRIGLGGTGALGEIASFRVDAYGHTTDGQRDLGNASGSKLLTTLRLQPSSDLRFELLADYSKQNPERYWGTPNDKGRIVSSLRNENYNVSDAIIGYEDKRLRGRVEWQANDWLTLRDEVYYFEANRHWKNVEQYSLNAAQREQAKDYQAALRSSLPWIDEGARARVEKGRVALDKIIAKEVGESSNMRGRLTKLDAQLKEQMNRIIEHRTDGLTFHYKAIDQVRADGQQLDNQAMGGILQDSINEMGAKAELKGGGKP